MIFIKTSFIFGLATLVYGLIVAHLESERNKRLKRHRNTIKLIGLLSVILFTIGALTILL